MSYDNACLELAEHFLRDRPDTSIRRALARELAQIIQDAVEVYLEYSPKAAEKS